MKKVIESAAGRPRVDAVPPSANTVKARESDNRATYSVPRTRTGAQTDTTGVSMLDGVRRMMVFATEGAFDLLDGQHFSKNLDRLEELRQNISGKLATMPANDGDMDVTFMLRRARDSFERFSESIRCEIIETLHPGTASGNLDAALERVKNSAITAGASLHMIERKISSV